MHEILEFIDLPWTSKFEESLSRQTIHERRTKAYEKDLTARQLDDLEKSLRDKLVHYGYSRLRMDVYLNNTDGSRSK